MQNQPPLKIFIVYAREDADALRELRVQFIPVAKSENLSVWYDGEILPGQHWDAEIKSQLQIADIILLFISKHFFASEYIQTTELRQALERHEQGLSVVVPVIVRPCVWQDAFDVSKFQALPVGTQPIFSQHWSDPDEALVNIVEELKKVGRKLREEQQSKETLKLNEEKQKTILRQTTKVKREKASNKSYVKKEKLKKPNALLYSFKVSKVFMFSAHPGCLLNVYKSGIEFIDPVDSKYSFFIEKNRLVDAKVTISWIDNMDIKLCNGAVYGDIGFVRRKDAEDALKKIRATFDLL